MPILGFMYNFLVLSNCDGACSLNQKNAQDSKKNNIEMAEEWEAVEKFKIIEDCNSSKDFMDYLE